MKWVIGVDEVGRGCLAGPVMVGVFAIRADAIEWLVEQGVADSKVLTSARRKQLFETLERAARAGTIHYAVAMQSSSVIDDIGIVEAIRLCIAEALAAVEIPPEQTHIYLDGGLRAPVEWKHQSTHIKGDRDYPVIGAASIMAKVLRDDYMMQLGTQFPEYCWGRNMGYGTVVHRTALHNNGLTKHHRVLFCRNSQRGKSA